MFTHATQDSQKELDKFLDLLSPLLELEVKTNIFGNIFRRNELFEQNNDKEMLEYVIQKITTSVHLPESSIVEERGESDKICFLATGRVMVYVNNVKISTLEPGALFGVIEFILN